MDAPSYLIINERQITYEMMGNEVIIIHLGKGYYYSLKGVAAEIWSYLLEGLTEQAITDKLVERYDAPAEKVASSVQRFVSKLKEEELVLLSSSRRSEDGTTSAYWPPVTENNQLFEEPIIEKYTDLEELLLLDPVHEVDEYGWPSRLGKEQK